MKKKFFRRYQKKEKGKVVFDVGWAIQIGRLVIRYNKQTTYRGLSFSIELGTEHYRIVGKEDFGEQNEGRITHQEIRKSA